MVELNAMKRNGVAGIRPPPHWPISPPYVRVTLCQGQAFDLSALQAALHAAVPRVPPALDSWEDVAQRNRIAEIVANPDTFVESEAFWAAAKIEETRRVNVYLGLRTHTAGLNMAPPSLHAVARDTPSIARAIVNAYVRQTTTRRLRWRADLMVAADPFDISLSGDTIGAAIRSEFFAKSTLQRVIPLAVAALVAALVHFLNSHPLTVAVAAVKGRGSPSTPSCQYPGVGSVLAMCIVFGVTWLVLAVLGAVVWRQPPTWSLGRAWKEASE